MSILALLFPIACDGPEGPPEPDATPAPAPAAPPAAAPAPAPPRTPAEAFRDWVETRAHPHPNVAIAWWGGELREGPTDAIAFEALVCSDDNLPDAGGAWHPAYATWLVELADGRRWAVFEERDLPCDGRPGASPPFGARAAGRVTFQGALSPREARTWGIVDGAPALLARSGGMGRDDWNYTFSVDAEACTQIITWRNARTPLMWVTGRPPGCGGFGEIPARRGAAGGVVEAKRQWGETEARLTAYAALAADGAVTLVSTIPPMDAEDHFELWLGDTSPWGPADSRRYRIGVKRTLGPLEATVDPADLQAAVVDGHLRIEGIGGIPPGWEPIPATLVFVDMEGGATRGIVATGRFLDGRPHPFNRIADPASRYERVEGVTEEAPAPRDPR